MRDSAVEDILKLLDAQLGDPTHDDSNKMRRHLYSQAFYPEDRKRGEARLLYAERLRTAFQQVAVAGTNVDLAFQGDIVMRHLRLSEQTEQNIL